MSDLRSTIDRVTSDARLKSALLMGALLEGGSLTGPWRAGDNGQSFGPYQIYTAAHPDVTREKAENPEYAVAYMLPAYMEGVRRVPSELWQSDPARAAATAVYYAERPAAMYPASRVRAAWARLQGAWTGAIDGALGQTDDATTFAGGLPGIEGWQALWSALTSRDTGIRLMAGGTAILLVIVGAAIILL
jgi:hypothetical protein